MEFKKNSFRITGQISHKLLPGHGQSITLLLRHRTNNKMQIFSVNNSIFNYGFDFTIFYKEFVFDESTIGVWDVFILSDYNGYVVEKRIGSQRNGDYKNVLGKVVFSSFGQYFSAKPYFTTPYGNLSFDTCLIEV
ncbi:hypothetical protein JOD43_003806 [Pullulanibacillus pueri]|uniref:TarS C-terminal domain-containing protein n=1 Tax=Pullulanibacillus pueri TaxID=1437324 RepID=A0A8J2ZTR5_9BACL|nr:hypothetical protein [Pullulanibacillus pueri]GGH76604.1 hypothetical protein GCM10007096_07280 [Pullulanibacillus pueri]